MNALFHFAGADDLKSNHSRVMEFWRLDSQIAKMEDEMSYKELFHSLEYAILNIRAKQIVKELNNSIN